MQVEAEISPDASPVQEEQDKEDYVFPPHRESRDDPPAVNKTSSVYVGSKSSSDEREDQDENEQWSSLHNIFTMQRFSDKKSSGTITYRSLQLEGPVCKTREEICVRTASA